MPVPSQRSSRWALLSEFPDNKGNLMANRFDSQVMEDGWRNAVVRITGVLDTSDASLTPAIALGDFTNNDVARQRFVGLRVDHIWHSIGDGLELQISWEALNPRLIMALAGRGRESFHTVGGLQPTSTDPGYSGNINLTTTGWGSEEQTLQNFTVMLEMVKLYKF